MNYRRVFSNNESLRLAKDNHLIRTARTQIDLAINAGEVTRPQLNLLSQDQRFIRKCQDLFDKKNPLKAKKVKKGLSVLEAVAVNQVLLDNLNDMVVRLSD